MADENGVNVDIRVRFSRERPNAVIVRTKTPASGGQTFAPRLRKGVHGAGDGWAITQPARTDRSLGRFLLLLLLPPPQPMDLQSQQT